MERGGGRGEKKKEKERRDKRLEIGHIGENDDDAAAAVARYSTPRARWIPTTQVL